MVRKKKDENLVQINQDEIVTLDEFSFWLKNIRVSLGMSQQEFSDRIGFPVSSIKNYEQAKSAPQDPFIFVEQVRALTKQKRK